MPRSTAEAMVPSGYNACPLDVAFGVVGKKWTVLIVRNLLRGHRHFNQFLANIPGINPKSLSTRLKELEREGIILKRVEGTSPVSIEYHLTPKGRAMLPILRQMVLWSVEWTPEKVFARGARLHDPAACLEEWQRDVLRAVDDKSATRGDLLVRARKRRV